MHVLFRPHIDDPRRVAAEPDWDAYRGQPLDVPSAMSRYRELTDRWAEIHGLRPSDLVREMDVEDWTENAVKLVAAVDAGLPVRTLARGDSHASIVYGAAHNGGDDADGDAVFLGTFLRWDPLFAPGGTAPGAPTMAWPPAGRHWLGGDYWRSPVLFEALGRRAGISTGNSDGENGYRAVTRRLVEAGAERLFAKIVFGQKYQQPTEIALPRGADGRPLIDDHSIEQAFYEAFEVNLMDCDGREECFLLQETRPLRAEYRVVVVGGEPVAGVGTVEWLCPLFHEPADGPFDPLVEGKRSDRALLRDEALVGRYRERAFKLCSALREGGGGRFENCTMDFALDAETGGVALIETNPLANFGLYAMDFEPVLDAAVQIALASEPAAGRVPAR